MKLAAVGVALAIVSGCLISPIIPIGSGKSSKQIQHEGLGKLFPAQLAALSKWTGEVRVAKLRVWADDEYRAQNLRWQHGFDEQLDYANQVLIPMLGVSLEAEYRAWQRHAPGSTLDDHLEALTRTDPGDDVVWVVGLTSSLSLVSGTFEQLGVAHLAGRHVVVRGHADVEERKAFARAFPDIAQDEQAAVLEARRRHKTTTVLIHELAHSLGALHETEPDWIMNPTYSHHAASISDRNRELMLLTLDDRLKPPAGRDRRATTQALLAALDVAWGGWPADERDELVATLRAQLGPPGAQAATGITGAVPAAALDEYQHAEKLLASGDHAGALAVLAPLLAAYPAHAELRVLACKIELARGGAQDRKAIATCDRAAALSAEVEPAIAVAAARLAAGDAPGVRATLAAAEARLASLPPGKAAAAWLTLAGQYQAMGALTWAEIALGNAGAAAGHPIAAWAATTRVRYGVPRNGARWKLAPEDDAAAVTAVRGVLASVNASKFDAAAKAAAAAEKRWPALPGLLAARCDLEMRRGALAPARQYCDRAIGQGGSSWALYLRGILELREEGPAATKAGIARLRAAIDLDPELGQAWRALGRALDRAQATAPLDQLRRDYQAHFGSPLPN
jgi:Matrixin